MSPLPVLPLGIPGRDQVFDERKLNIQVGHSEERRAIVLDFGAVVKRLYLTPAEARSFVAALNAEIAVVDDNRKRTRRKRKKKPNG